MKKLFLIAGLSFGLLALGNLNNVNVTHVDGKNIAGTRILNAEEKATFVTINPLDPIKVHKTTSIDTFKKSLPNTAKAIFSDGSEKEVKVTFDDPTADQISKKGSFELKGKADVDGENKDVTLEVEVIELVQVSSPKLRVQKGKEAVLPSEVYAVYSDGSYEALPVTFSNVDTKEVGTKETTGKVQVDGVEQEVKATVNVVDQEVKFSHNRYAKSISVNGTPIPNFANTKGNGSLTGGYGTEPIQNFKLAYDAKEATVTAKSYDSNATTLVIQGGIGEDNPSYVFVFPEDGNYPFVYTVTSTNNKAALVSAELTLTSDKVKVGDVIKPTVIGKDQAEKDITSKEGAVTFTVDNNYSGIAQVDGKEITAIQEGLVRISASMEYEGKTVYTNTLNVIIEKGDEEIYPTSVKDSQIVIKKGEDYSLPKSVEVTLSNGNIISRPVSWNNIPNVFLSRPGIFSVQGRVYGYENISAKLIVTVVTSGEKISSSYSTTMLTGKPTALPSKLLTGFESDGTPIYTNVGWDQSRFNTEFKSLKNGQSADAWYQINGNWLGTMKIYASDGETSADLTQLANGYDKAPAAIASKSAEGVTNKFVDNGGDWIADKSEKTPYAGFLFGNAGVVQKETIDTVNLTFKKGNGIVLPSQVKIFYFNKELDNNSLPSSYEPYLNIKGTNAPSSVSSLAAPANWTEVTNQTGNIAEGESTFTFDSVNTYAFRAVFYYEGGNTDAGVVSVSNIVAIRKFVSLGNKAPELKAINIGEGEKSTDIYKAGQTEYTVEYDDQIPQVSADLADGQKGDLVVANNFGDDSVRIKAISEDGKDSQIYVIHFKSKSNDIHYITDVEGLESLSVQSAKTAEEMNLPSSINVTLDDGSKKEVPVTFDTSKYEGKKGRYVFEGTLMPDDFTINTLDLETSIIVEVKEDSKAETDNPGTPNTPDNPDTPITTKTNNGLDGGDIAAIVLGVMLGTVLIGGVTYFLILKKSR